MRLLLLRRAIFCPQALFKPPAPRRKPKRKVNAFDGKREVHSHRGVFERGSARAHAHVLDLVDRTWINVEHGDRYSERPERGGTRESHDGRRTRVQHPEHTHPIRLLTDIARCTCPSGDSGTMQALEEDVYVSSIEKIIRRDFFPGEFGPSRPG